MSGKKSAGKRKAPSSSTARNARARGSEDGVTRSESFDELCQKIECTKIDPGIAIEYADDATIHAVLGLPNSMAAQGNTPAASAAAFKAWFVGVVSAAHPQCRVPLLAGGFSDAHFEHLDIPEYNQVLGVLGSNAAIAWAHDCMVAVPPVSAGRFFGVSHKGRGFNQMDQFAIGPFRG
jgi:hypothetical protein